MLQRPNGDLPLFVSYARVETLRSYQLSQSKVALERCTRRSDTNATPFPHDRLPTCRSDRGFGGLAVREALMNPSVAINKFIAEPSAVTKKVAIHLMVVAIDHAS